jgi:hypothetical protein
MKTCSQNAEADLKRRSIWLALPLAFSACDNSERNVITGTAPFYHVSVAFSKTDSDQVITDVQAFARQNRMDFLLSRDEPRPGDFNVSANSSSLNLKVLHVRGVADGLDVYAISRTGPNNEDWKLTKEFACKVAERC